MTFPVTEFIDSGLPPVLYVSTGVPQASASIFVVGKLSTYVGLTNTSAVAYSFARSLMLSVRFIPTIPSGKHFNSASFNPTRHIDIFKPTINIENKKIYCIKTDKMLLGVANIWDQRKGLNDFIQSVE